MSIKPIKKENKSKFPYYAQIPLSVDESSGEIEWTITKISDKDEERDILTDAKKFIKKWNHVFLKTLVINLITL